MARRVFGGPAEGLPDLFLLWAAFLECLDPMDQRFLHRIRRHRHLAGAPSSGRRQVVVHAELLQRCRIVLVRIPDAIEVEVDVVAPEILLLLPRGLIGLDLSHQVLLGAGHESGAQHTTTSERGRRRRPHPLRRGLDQAQCGGTAPAAEAAGRGGRGHAHGRSHAHGSSHHRGGHAHAHAHAHGGAVLQHHPRRGDGSRPHRPGVSEHGVAHPGPGLELLTAGAERVRHFLAASRKPSCDLSGLVKRDLAQSFLLFPPPLGFLPGGVGGELGKLLDEPEVILVEVSRRRLWGCVWWRRWRLPPLLLLRRLLLPKIQERSQRHLCNRAPER
mmetsp:Transcript_98995/g.258649  ORF Transcript_98995/g.258649 Transcript_98995/m.258649 type:complete len:330 (+) Transcript_98995:188-1177(+)